MCERGPAALYRPRASEQVDHSLDAVAAFGMAPGLIRQLAHMKSFDQRARRRQNPLVLDGPAAEFHLLNTATSHAGFCTSDIPRPRSQWPCHRGSSVSEEFMSAFKKTGE
jgi:hypothetical protein